MNAALQMEDGQDPRRFGAPQRSSRQERRLRVMRIWLGYILLFLLGYPVLIYFSVPHLPPIDQVLGYLTLLICTIPVVVHLASHGSGLPVFPIICLVYASGYALPVFFSVPIVVSMSAHGGIAKLKEADVSYAIALSALGIFCMQMGFLFFRFSILHLLIPQVQLILDLKKSKKWMNMIGAAGLVILWLSSTGKVNIPKNFFYLFILVTKLSFLSMALLYYYFLKEQLTPKEKLWLVLMGIFLSGLALGSGNLRAVFDPTIILGAVYWMVRRRFPWKYMTLAVLFFLVLQPVKAAFREQVWARGFQSVSITQRLEIWFTLLKDQWSSALSGKSHNTEATTRGSLNRADLIHPFARVISITPRRVPYQLGKTYDYLFYALVPRFVWPSKPGAQAANEFFGVAYDFQTLESVQYTSIGMPHLIECYVNFGALGVIVIMILIGMVYSAVERALNHEKAGEGGVALYATLMTSLWTIETATAPTFGALVQTTILYGAILWWLRFRPEKKKKGLVSA
jgi:hypothetical protein